MNPVSYRETRGIAVVTIDHPPVNALSVVVREGLRDAIAKAKPTGAKGKYVRKIALSSSMGPGVKVDVAEVASV